MFDNLPLEAKIGVTDVKRRDVLSLMQYIKPCNRSFYTRYLNNDTKINTHNDESDADESDLFGLLIYIDI